MRRRHSLLLVRDAILGTHSVQLRGVSNACQQDDWQLRMAQALQATGHRCKLWKLFPAISEAHTEKAGSEC